jgi:branched-chain amino acid aminotransferase
MGMESKYVWMDGELVDFEKATVHMLTPALHYGAAVFEGIRAYNTDKGPAVFRLTEHADRLLDSARVFGMRELPFTVEDVVKGVKDTVRANGFTDCYIRPLLYIKGGAWNLNVDAGKPALAIAVWQWSNYLGEEAWRRESREHFIIHAPSSQCEHDQGEDRRELCEQLPCQDRIGTPRFSGSHYARPAGLYR